MRSGSKRAAVWTIAFLFLGLGPLEAAPFMPRLPAHRFVHPVQARDTVLSGAEVAGILRRIGYRDVTPLRRRGGTYVADATGPDGARYRLVLDAYTGEITGTRPIGAPSYGSGGGYTNRGGYGGGYGGGGYGNGDY